MGLSERSWLVLGSFWSALGGLFGDFIEIWCICWIALTLEPQLYFVRFGGSWAALLGPLFQVRFTGLVFQ